MPLTILYVGGSYPQRIAVRELVRAGFEVHVTDREMDPPCAAETPHTHQINATDVEGVLKLAQSLRERGKLIGAYGIGDYAFPAVVAVNRLIGGRTPPADAVVRMLDKAATKEALSKFGVPMARTLWAGNATEFDPATLKQDMSIGEVIVKPVGVHASRGVARVEYRDSVGLRAAVEAAGREDERVLIEEFLAGDICNFDAIALDGEVVPVSMTYRITHDTLPFLSSAQIQPRWREVEDRSDLLAVGRQVAGALGYRNGPFTIDYIRTRAGPRVLEVSPHLHLIGLEIIRGNGNPLRGWFRYLAADPGWRHDLERGRETAGAFITSRATRLGTLMGVEGEAALRDDPRCVDYCRWKLDGDEIASTSAADGLVALAWLVGVSGPDIERVVRRRMKDFAPIVTSTRRTET